MTLFLSKSIIHEYLLIIYIQLDKSCFSIAFVLEKQ
jgi:hypothetical protein